LPANKLLQPTKPSRGFGQGSPTPDSSLSRAVDLHLTAATSCG